MATILKRTFKAKIQAALEQVPEDRLEKWLETEFSEFFNNETDRLLASLKRFQVTKPLSDLDQTIREIRS